MAFYQKYRAKSFGEMVGQEHVVATLLQAVKSKKIVHAYLLTGPRGIGKTSTARLLAKAINCQKINDEIKSGKEIKGEPCNECDSCREISDGRAIDVIEIDAASHTGVDDIRELIDKARLAPTKSAKKVYIIDEVHMLSKSAFNALLKTLEEPPKHVVFIMATTEVHKIPATILSRAQRFDFKRASKIEIIENLGRIAKTEKLEIDGESLDLIAVSAAGGHRDAVGLLEKIAAAGGKITIDKTRNILGVAESGEVYEFVGAIFNKNPEEGLKIAHRLYEKGYDMGEFNKSIIELLRRLLILKTSSKVMFEDTKENIGKIQKLSTDITIKEIINGLECFIEAGTLLKDVYYPILPVEMALVKAVEQAISSKLVSSKQEQKTAETTGSRIISLGEAEPRRKSGMTEKGSLHIGRDDKQVKQEPEDSNKPVSAQGRAEAEAGQPPEKGTVEVIEMTKDIWQQIIDLTKGKNATLAALLRDAKPMGMTSDTLTIAVKFKFHKERISEPKNCQILEEVVNNITGSKLKVACQLTDGKAILARKEDPGSIEDMEKTVGEVFEIS